MCDTLVARGNSTADGCTILAKNSDRPPNEAQRPVYIPRAMHRAASVQCTFIEIPQVAETFAILISQPFWMWGGEMGINEWGVAIGNEAVFTKEPYQMRGLTGMDLLRLALERAETARRALDVIVNLLETWGQHSRGTLGFGQPYHNSFLIADPTDAWVLETAGRYWVARQVRDTWSISNGLTIGRDWDMIGPGVIEHAVAKGWCRSAADLDWARCYSDRLYTPLGQCRRRQQTTSGHLQADQGKITVSDMMSYLRDHGDTDDDAWTPVQWQINVCAHAAAPLLRHIQSTASMVAHLRPDAPTAWLTATSAPCTGIFKPFHLGPLPAEIGQPGGRTDSQSLWWIHEKLHRAVIADYATRMPLYRAGRDELETTFVAQEHALYQQNTPEPTDWAAFDRQCFDLAWTATQRWSERVMAVPPTHRPPWWYRQYWRRQNRLAGLLS